MLYVRGLSTQNAIQNNIEKGPIKSYCHAQSIFQPDSRILTGIHISTATFHSCKIPGINIRESQS